MTVTAVRITTAPVVELIFSIAEEGVGLHTICNRLRKAKVLKPSFYKKELFERFMDEEKMYDWDTAYVSQILHNPVYAGNLTVADKPTKTMRSKKRQYIPYAERETMARMSRLSNRTVGTTCRRFCRADRPLSGKVQADMTTFSEGLSNVLIVGVPCLPKSSRKESVTM